MSGYRPQAVHQCPPLPEGPAAPKRGLRFLSVVMEPLASNARLMLARSELARLDLNSAVVSNVHRPVGRSELLRRGPSLQSVPGRLELRLGGVEILG